MRRRLEREPVLRENPTFDRTIASTCRSAECNLRLRRRTFSLTLISTLHWSARRIQRITKSKIGKRFQFPEVLDQLLDPISYLCALPPDPYSPGEIIKYSTDENVTHCQVCSVGPDCENNDGDPTTDTVVFLGRIPNCLPVTFHKMKTRNAQKRPNSGPVVNRVWLNAV